LATYVRATTYWRYTPTNFWQEAPKWDDDRVRVFAGLAGRDHESGTVASILEGVGILDTADTEALAALRRAEEATISRVRRLLAILASDWKQLSAYFLAFKHGGLAINRADSAFVDDDVEEITDVVVRHDPSVAVWTRGGRKQEANADFKNTPEELVTFAGGGGRLAIDLVDAFIESRSAVFEALAIAPDGTLLGLRPMQVPWTIWLREQDLPAADWKLLGRGPRIAWHREEDASPGE
jgi:hypothetical protein